MSTENKRNIKDKITIEFNSKLLSIPVLQKLKDSYTEKNVVTGSAITKVVDDHIKLLYLAQTIVNEYEKSNEEGVRKAIEILKLIL